jgi:predicted Zn finger-like uncharacterized protein
MDVRCERCNTEYEFDDALVSGRGTTVKCTNCGHKFKIRRNDGDYSEDFWNVLTRDGRTLVFTSLRELQRAIQTHLVERHDTISRGGLPHKPIGQIPELAPFFDLREEPARRSVPPAGAGAGADATSRSVSSGRLKSSRPPPPPGTTGPALAPPRARQSTRPDFPPPSASSMASMKKTLAGTGSEDTAPVNAPPPMRARMSSVPPPLPAAARTDSKPPSTERMAEAPAERAPSAAPAPAVAAAEAPAAAPAPLPVVDVPRQTPPPPPFEASSPLPPPTAPVIRAMGLDVEEYESMRPPSASLPDAPVSMGRRRSVGGFVVVTALLLGVAVLAAAWARDHLGPMLGLNKSPTPAATADPRVADLLATGNKALADGNLDLARESFDKASVLADKDPHVLVAEARLLAMRADVPWLKARLLPPTATDEQKLAKDNLAELAQKARTAADAALAAAPDDPDALRAKIDALRLAGDRDGARALVGKIAAGTAQAESAYVLAALDLAEAQPLWSTVTERLRVAATAESGPGRARAALVYALARSGDIAGAKGELDRLAAMPRRSELYPLLRAFVEHEQAAEPDAGAAAATTDAGGAAAATSGKKPEHEPTGGGGGGGGGALPSDPRVLVAHGEAARAKGDYDRAQTLYSAALDKNPADTEALSGLAAVAYARRDLSGARASYKRVLSINPSYVPALVGVADCDWESGDRASAMKTYKEIVDRFPEGTYPPRVKQRSEAAAPAPTPAPAPAPTSTEAQ